MKLLMFLVLFCVLNTSFSFRKRAEDKTKCPKVKAIRNFDLEQVKI